MTWSFCKRLVGRLFCHRGQALISFGLLFILSSLLVRAHFFFFILALFGYLSLYFIGYDYLAKTDKVFWLLILFPILFQAFRLNLQVTRARQAERLAKSRHELFLTRVEDLDISPKGNRLAIFENKAGERFACWLKVDQGHVQTLKGSFFIEKPDGQRNPGGFSEKAYLASHNCYAKLKLPPAFKGQDQGWTKEKFNRQNFYQDFALWLSQKLGQDPADFLISFCFAQKQYLNQTLKRDFRNLGLQHVLAVSGFHFDLFILPLLSLFQLRRSVRIKRLLLLSPAILFFNWLTFFPVGLVRASLTFILSDLFTHFSIKISKQNILSLILVGWLFRNPIKIFQLNFQLSFLAAFVIYLVNPHLQQVRLLKNRPILASFCLSSLVQVSLLPILLLSFGRWQLSAIFLNFFLSFPLLIMFCSGFFACLAFCLDKYLAITIFDRLFKFLAWVFRYVFLAFSKIARSGPANFLNSGRWDALTVFIIAVVLLVFSCLSIFYYRRFLGHRAGCFRPGLASLAIFLVVALLTLKLIFVRPCWIICFLDVDQGDSCLIISPDSHSILIDGGIRGKGYQVIIPALDYFGLKNVDYGVISHLDLDHSGGILDLLESELIEEVFLPDLTADQLSVQGADKVVYQDLEHYSTKFKIPLHKVRQGDSLEFPKLRFSCQLISPGMEQLTGKIDPNNTSLCFYLPLPELSILYTGDIDSKLEEGLLAAGLISQADILKVPHHGSKYSSSDLFLRAINPRYALISAGRYNNYGHPSSDVLRRLEKYSTEIWRTDRQGAIVLKGRGNKWIWTGFVNQVE